MIWVDLRLASVRRKEIPGRDWNTFCLLLQQKRLKVRRKEIPGRDWNRPSLWSGSRFHFPSEGKKSLEGIETRDSLRGPGTLRCVRRKEIPGRDWNKRCLNITLFLDRINVRRKEIPGRDWNYLPLRGPRLLHNLSEGKKSLEGIETGQAWMSYWISCCLSEGKKSLEGIETIALLETGIKIPSSVRRKEIPGRDWKKSLEGIETKCLPQGQTS